MKGGSGGGKDSVRSALTLGQATTSGSSRAGYG